MFHKLSKCNQLSKRKKDESLKTSQSNHTGYNKTDQHATLLLNSTVFSPNENRSVVWLKRSFMREAASLCNTTLQPRFVFVLVPINLTERVFSLVDCKRFMSNFRSLILPVNFSSHVSNLNL